MWAPARDTLNEVVDLLTAAINLPYEKIVRKPARLCDVKQNVLSVDRLMNVTGWKPKISLEDGIRLLLEQ